MIKLSIVGTFAILSSLVAGCGSSPPPEAASAPSAMTPASGTSSAATKPELAAAKKHLAEHVKYPATRAEVLAACADTPEFSDAEKKWFSDNLPEGSYESADQVTSALKL